MTAPVRRAVSPSPFPLFGSIVLTRKSTILLPLVEPACQVWVESFCAEGTDWHGIWRFRVRRLWRVNREALRRVAGQTLKRLLKQRGCRRRPSPAEALHAPLGGFLVGVDLAFFAEVLSFLGKRFS